MDGELLIALVVLWFSTTFALVTFLRMWFGDDGAAFHPHSVDVEHRHSSFLVVHSTTFCKIDCPVKSISTFVAPRGSSSSKQFTVLIVMISVAGFLGTSRWYFVGDASYLEAVLSFIGFASLLLVTGFELDVVPERFLEDKLIVTGWLIEKLKLKKRLPFSLSPDDEGFRDFIRQSKEIYYLYDEDKHIQHRGKRSTIFRYQPFWPTLHMIGACSYIGCVTASIIINDYNEEKVAWITGSLFGLFCFMAYLTGNYVPVLKYLRGWILLWNPFLKEPYFMYKLKKACDEYLMETNNPMLLRRKSLERSNSTGSKDNNNNNKEGQHHSLIESGGSGKHSQLRHRSVSSAAGGGNSIGNSPLTPSKKMKAINYNNNTISNNSNNNGKLDPDFLKEAEEADKALDSIFLHYARHKPAEYLKAIGYLFVLSELIAMMTPSVAMGIQWVTALCDGPPLLSIIDLLYIVWTCVSSGVCDLQNSTHCILKH